MRYCDDIRLNVIRQQEIFPWNQFFACDSVQVSGMRNASRRASPAIESSTTNHGLDRIRSTKKHVLESEISSTMRSTPSKRRRVPRLRFMR